MQGDLTLVMNDTLPEETPLKTIGLVLEAEPAPPSPKNHDTAKITVDDKLKLNKKVTPFIEEGIVVLEKEEETFCQKYRFTLPICIITSLLAIVFISVATIFGVNGK